MRQDIHNSAIPVVCRECEARHGGICSVLEPSELLRLGRRARRREIPPGTELVTAGIPVETYANILSGVVKLTKLLPDGRQQIVGVQFAPDFLGRPFANTSGVSAVAASTVRLCVFPRAELEDMARQSHRLEHRLYAQSLRELDDAREWMMILGQKSASQKLASFLLLLGTHMDPKVDGCADVIELPWTRADIADFLGLTIETVSRQLTRLRNGEVISIEKNRHVTVLDHAALRSEAGV